VSAQPPDVVPPHVVEAARHVLARDGLAAATLERISTAAGVSRMTLHRRGLSRGDILQAIARRLEHDYREAIWPALVSRGSGRERLRGALELLCAVTEENRATLAALSSVARDEIYHDPGPARLTRKVFAQPLERLLLDGAADGSLGECDAREMATLLVNAVCHTYGHLRSGHGWAPRRARQGVIRQVMDALVASLR
jgi:AcrR family transcriptional regulator